MCCLTGCFVAVAVASVAAAVAGKIHPHNSDIPDYQFDEEEETSLNKDKVDSYNGTDKPTADSSTPIVLGYGRMNEPDTVITTQPTSSS